LTVLSIACTNCISQAYRRLKATGKEVINSVREATTTCMLYNIRKLTVKLLAGITGEMPSSPSPRPPPGHPAHKYAVGLRPF
jgi:hypothetical protein